MRISKAGALLLSVLPLLFSTLPVFAAETVGDLTESEWHVFVQDILNGGVPVVDSAPYYCIYSIADSDTYTYGVLFSEYPVKYANNDLQTKGMTFVYKYNGSWVSCYGQSHADYQILNYTSIHHFTYSDGVFLSNHNITYVGMNDIFFHKAPLARIALATVKPEEMMKEVVGLLPLLMPCLIFVIGFLKALKFLLNLLRQT